MNSILIQLLNSKALMLTAALWAAPFTRMLADTVVVDARRSIFSQATDTDGSVDNTSLPAVAITLPPGTNRILTFSNVSGAVDPFDSPHGADGGFFGGYAVNINSFGIISGILDSSNNTLALMGVFTTATPANGSDLAPPRLDFSTNHSFASLAPSLNQSFFIGDGRTGTGSGATQQFFVPDSAAYLHLGFADGYDGNPFHGDPAAYHDNHGSLTVTTNVVPEPSTALFCIAGVLGWLLRRTRK